MVTVNSLQYIFNASIELRQKSRCSRFLPDSWFLCICTIVQQRYGFSNYRSHHFEFYTDLFSQFRYIHKSRLPFLSII